MRAFRDPIFVAIVLVGLVLSIALSTLVHRENEAAASLWLTERAELIALATEDTVDRTFADLRAVAAFLGTTDSVTQDRFSSFVAQMDMNPGVIGIGYLSVVDDAGIDAYVAAARDDVATFELLSFDGAGGIGPNLSPRPTYYPLRFVHGGPFLDVVIAETPIQSQIDALGFDLGTEPLWFPAFQRAIALPTPSVSDMVGIGGAFEEQAFAAAHPLLDEAGELEGVLIAPGLEILLTTDLGVSITSNVEWQIDNAIPGTEETDWPVWHRHLDLPGTTWTLTVEPTESARSDLSSLGHLFVLAIGTALTAALATTARQIRLRRQEHAKVAQLHQLSEDKDRFLATVSHELRTPLTVVIGLAAELADNGDGFDPAEHAELLGMIENHGQEAGAIVEDLLVAARSDIDKIAVNNEIVDLSEAVTTALLASPIDNASVIGVCGSATADPSRVRQILRNLLTNAARYGGETVEIRLDQTAEMSVIVVADNGAPISQDHEQAIFDPYVSAHEGGSQLGSIGLGLFISQKLARLMGGDLVYRHDGNHVLFELSLPRAEVAETTIS